MSTRIHKLWPSWVLFVGLVVLFAGERVFDGDPSVRPIFAGLGAVLIAVALIVRVLEWASAGHAEAAIADRRPVLMTIVLCTAGVGVAMVLYSLIPLVFDGDDSASERIRGVLWAIWPITLAASGFPLLFLETAVAPVAYIDRYERAQIRRATTRGLALALFLAILFVGNYLANRHDKKLELSEATAVQAGDQTRKFIRELTKDVRVVLFFPKSNDVGERVAQYFEPLEALNPKLSVERIDHALAFELAKEARVTENGFVALFSDKSNDKIRLGTQYRSSRSALRRFDENFVRSLIRVTSTRKTAYFYTGHDERAYDRPRSDDKRQPVKKLQTQLKAWQYDIKPFTVADGSTDSLPKDADVLFIMGPEKPFLTAEIDVLKAAIQKGVRLFIALESERSGDEMQSLLTPLGLRFDKTPLAAPASHIPLTKTRADFSFLYSTQFSTHSSVTTMTRNTGKVAAIFFRTGSLSVQQEGRLPGVKTDIVLTARRDVFADANDNLTFDKGEVKKSFGLAAAVTATSTSGKAKDESRIFVLADADVMGDQLFNLLPGNVYFLLDIVRWLERKPDAFVPTTSERDIKIIHKGTEDALVFYGTTLAVPALILILGAFATRRKGRS